VTALLRLESLHVSYGKVVALRRVSLRLDPGAIVSIIGANGAGKSTLLNAISGVLSYSGRIYFDGHPLPKAPHEVVRAGVVQVPEGRGVFSSLTVEENLMMGAFTVRDRQLRQKRLSEAYARFPLLEERRRQRAGTLSGGEQQMLAVGRGLMSDPKLLLLDEPSLGLAPKLVTDVFDLLGEINGQGTTILLVEQNARKALAIADWAYVLETGQVVADGPGDQLLGDPIIRKAYLGSAGNSQNFHYCRLSTFIETPTCYILWHS